MPTFFLSLHHSFTQELSLPNFSQTDTVSNHFDSVTHSFYLFCAQLIGVFVHCGKQQQQ